MIEVTTGSRLHFGLFTLAGKEALSNYRGDALIPQRSFGGVGLMVSSPGLSLKVAAASAWSAAGPHAKRALDYAHRVTAALAPATESPVRIEISHSAPEHAGLGTGTQLGLAVAAGLARLYGRKNLDGPGLARLADRGHRSALGIHGFTQGGFLVEAGKLQPGGISPLVVRARFPEDWRIVIVLPQAGEGLHGLQEESVFASAVKDTNGMTVTESLCRLTLLGMVPALAEKDLKSFGEALHDFNARAGAFFAPVQGGIYSNPRIAELVDFIRRQGVAGVGQSSWGPAVFAIVASEEEGRLLAATVCATLAIEPARTWVTRASNQGATVQGATGEEIVVSPS